MAIILPEKPKTEEQHTVELLEDVLQVFSHFQQYNILMQHWPAFCVTRTRVEQALEKAKVHLQFTDE